MLRPSLPLSVGLLLLRLQSTAVAVLGLEIPTTPAYVAWDHGASVDPAGFVDRDLHGETTGPARQLSHESFTVELTEILQVGDAEIFGAYDILYAQQVAEIIGGMDPIDADCPAAEKCIGVLTRDGSLELDSRYGCTEPFLSTLDDSRNDRGTCGVYYALSASYDETSTIASVKIALHPDSITTLTVEVGQETAVEEWEAAPGYTGLQEIPGLEGLKGSGFRIKGVMEEGDYFAILEVEIYVTVDDVPVIGTSAGTRISITATATTDASSAMNTLDGDATDSSSWTCSSGEVCEITYDLQAPESLEQLRIAFSETTGVGGHLNVMAAGESGVYSMLRAGIEAGGRPLGTDGLQTFGGLRALARYVKIEVVPSNGGSIVMNEIEFRVGDVAPVRRVDENRWLTPTGPLPLGYEPGHDGGPAPSDGRCDFPAHFEGCHTYYMKDGDMETQWTCGPLMAEVASSRYTRCDVGISLNYYRYVRQIQIAFHLGDEQHNEFSIEAETNQGWMTVVASAISSGDTTNYQTFDVSVHAKTLILVPKFQRFNQWFSVKEMVILERRPDDLLAGTIPVFNVRGTFENDDVGSSSEIPTRLSFDLPSINDGIRFRVGESTVTALRIRFPADREFVFELSYSRYTSFEGVESFSERFTSAGGENELETFTFSEPMVNRASDYFDLIAVSGPTFANVPDYPALRVVDFHVVGERSDNGPGYFNMVSTAMAEWGLIPDIIGDGVSDQEDIMTAICETKGATFDGTDCVGELDDSTVHIFLKIGRFYLDGPIFVKSGVTLEGAYSDSYPTRTFFSLYEGANNGKTAEEAIVVVDGVTDVTVDDFSFIRKTEVAGDIVPGTLGNLCIDVRNSKDIRLNYISPDACRTGAAHFTDSSNITTFSFFASKTLETGNSMELTRVDDFYARSFPDMGGLLMDSCNNIVMEGYTNAHRLQDARLSPPTGGSQTANVVITGDSSGIVFQHCHVGPGTEPRILMESTTRLTLDDILEYEEAASGDCIVGVPEGSADDLVVQVNVNEQALSKSGDCWVLD